MTTSATGEPTETRPLPLPYWPESPFDPVRARVSYDAPADELMVYFDRDRRTGGVCDPIGLAEGTIAVVYDGDTGEIVGVQGIPFLLGAVGHRPDWAVLPWGKMAGEFGDQALNEALPSFVAEARDAFARSGLVGVPLTGLAAGTSRS